MKWGISMNNQMPFFNPFQAYPNPQMNQNYDEYEKLINKIERLEKNIRILDNRITKLEQNNNHSNPNYNEEPTDMYII